MINFLRRMAESFFPNPNAPTGKYAELEAVEQILQKNVDSVVVVDEAYIDFGGKSAVGLINKYSNLLIVQTVSKIPFTSWPADRVRVRTQGFNRSP